MGIKGNKWEQTGIKRNKKEKLWINKGQKISEWKYKVVALPKMWTKKLENFCP